MKQDGKSCFESVNAVRYQAGEIFDALFKLAEQSSDSKVRCEAESLCKQLKNFNFIVSNAFWYDILFQFNYISKELQNISVGLATEV